MTVVQLAIPRLLKLLPPTITFRTLIDPKRHILTDFQSGRCSDQAADGTPIMETHYIYQNGEYMGCINRMFSYTPWRIAPVGWPSESRHSTQDFNGAVLEVIEWRNREKQADRDWLKSLKKNHD